MQRGHQLDLAFVGRYGDDIDHTGRLQHRVRHDEVGRLRSGVVRDDRHERPRASAFGAPIVSVWATGRASSAFTGSCHPAALAPSIAQTSSTAPPVFRPRIVHPLPSIACPENYKDHARGHKDNSTALSAMSQSTCSARDIVVVGFEGVQSLDITPDGSVRGREPSSSRPCRAVPAHARVATRRRHRHARGPAPRRHGRAHGAARADRHAHRRRRR